MEKNPENKPDVIERLRIVADSPGLHPSIAELIRDLAKELEDYRELLADINDEIHALHAQLVIERVHQQVRNHLHGPGALHMLKKIPEA